MNTFVLQRRMAALAVVLSCMLFALLFQQTTASAQQCSNSSCTGLTIYNCTSIAFKVRFQLCCGNIPTLGPVVGIPSSVPCTVPAAVVNYAPCTILGVAAISPAPPPTVTVVYNPATCTVFIF